LVDVEIGVRGDLTVEESHKIAEAVHDKLESQKQYPVKHATVHVNPATALQTNNEEEKTEEAGSE